jgi:two-component system sensor histidine kinase CiaH
MFQKAVVRLTLWYLAVIVLLSAVFSIALYNVSTRELTAFQQRQEELDQSTQGLILPQGFIDLNQQRLEEVETSKRRIALNLFYFNLIILALGGAISYLLAKQTLQPIEEALEAQNRFTADASHELRTPLTAMRTEIEVALRDKQLILTDSRALHKSTLEEVSKLESLVNGLLTLAHKKHTEDATSFAALSVRELIQEAVTRMQKVAKAHGNPLEVTVQDVTIQGDSWRLTELLVILTDNAIKYSPKGSPVLIVATAKDRHVLLTVEDSGTGIPPDDLPHIFDRFYRADHSRSKERIEGYGLGLSIAQQIAEAHQGKIEVESMVGKGSRFTVKLPLK